MAVPEFVANPLGAIRERFDAAVAGAGGRAPDPDSDWGVASHFRRQLTSEAAISSVPLLTKATFGRVMPPGTLVRYRGMVQYGFPIMYHEPAIPDAQPSGLKWHMGRYAPLPDNVVDPPGATPRRASHMEFYCVPVPAQGSWSRDATLRGANELAESVWAAKRSAAGAGPRAAKRRANDDEDDDEDVEGGGAQDGAAQAAARRARLELESSTAAAPTQALSSSSSSAASASAAGSELMPPPSGTPADAVAPIDAYNPFPGEEDECPCLATLFGVGEDTPLRAGQAVEIFGVLQGDVAAAPPGGPASVRSLGPAEAAALGLSSVQAHMMTQPEHWALNPSAAHVPRVHAIVWRTLAPAFPLLQPPLAPTGPFSLLDVTTFAARCVAEAPSAADAAADVWGAADAAVAAVPRLASPEKTFARELAARSAAVEASGAAALAALPTMAGKPPATLRAELISFLSALTAGDQFAAEFVLLALLSRVVVRGADRPVGKLSVNITGFPECVAAGPDTPSFAAAAAAPDAAGGSTPPAPLPPGPMGAEQLRAAGVAIPLATGGSHWSRLLHTGVKLVLPRAALLPMTRAALQSVDIVPRKDNVLDRLRGGVLQLPDGTALIVDETLLQTGEYHGRAFKALHALRTLATNSQALYDFSASDGPAGACVLSFPADLPLLVVSHGKSVLDCDAVVPLSASAKASAAAAQTSAMVPPPPTAEFLERSRLYLATARHLPFAYAAGMRDVIQADLAAFKGSHTADDPVQVADLHRLLDTARLVAASLGATELTREHWEHVKRLETERRERVRASRATTAAASAPSNRARVTLRASRAAAAPPGSAAATAGQSTPTRAGGEQPGTPNPDAAWPPTP
ncbi:hypothetical protein FNF27_01372 [Cafeteria roenbergensis]|uniref:Mini-chromosome maintenance complex-binding protein n=1 Tax=Cafeteria roenbergensis TaxID=33653 RepID=A0A5A8EHL2_CAFRO|nr:hypothetical protein FNF27_01372 [Cafeteria roenbergensis]